MILRRIATITLLLVFLTACASNTLSTPDVKNIPPTDSPVPPQATPTPTTPQSGEQEGETPVSPLEPLPGEDKMIRGSVFVESSEILLLESFPVQAVLQISGALPTPCHKLRANVSEPNEKNEIQVELFSLTDPGAICIQVLQPFETSIPLGSYESGEYTVFVNGEEVGKITL